MAISIVSVPSATNSPPPPTAPAVLMDVLQGIPTAAVVRLQPVEAFKQSAHVLLLQVCGWVGGLALPRLRSCGRISAVPPRAARASPYFTRYTHTTLAGLFNHSHLRRGTSSPRCAALAVDCGCQLVCTRGRGPTPAAAPAGACRQRRSHPGGMQQRRRQHQLTPMAAGITSAAPVPVVLKYAYSL